MRGDKLAAALATLAAGVSAVVIISRSGRETARVIEATGRMWQAAYGSESASKLRAEAKAHPDDPGPLTRLSALYGARAQVWAVASLILAGLAALLLVADWLLP